MGCIYNFGKRKKCSPSFGLPIFKEILAQRKKKDKKNRSKVLHLLSTACNYNFIKLSMCIYNFNVAFSISINLVLICIY